jgi:hypothetical protein
VKLAVHLQLVQRSRITDVYIHCLVRPHRAVLSRLSTSTTLHLLQGLSSGFNTSGCWKGKSGRVNTTGRTASRILVPFPHARRSGMSERSVAIHGPCDALGNCHDVPKCLAWALTIQQSRCCVGPDHGGVWSTGGMSWHRMERGLSRPTARGKPLLD